MHFHLCSCKYSTTPSRCHLQVYTPISFIYPSVRLLHSLTLKIKGLLDGVYEMNTI